MIETTRALWRETLNNHPRGLLVTLGSVIGIALALRVQAVDWLQGWTMAALMLIGLRYGVYLLCRPSLADGAAPANEVLMIRLHHVGVISSGLVWAMLAWWGVPWYQNVERFTILVVLSALAGGSTATLAPLRISGKIYIALLLLPACFQLLLIGDDANITLAVLGAMFCGVMMSTHASNHGLLLHAIELSQDKENLILQLSSANSALEGRYTTAPGRCARWPGATCSPAC
ncbi:hypothetical protein ACLB1G_07245 [Oxalobacteraceae bacterium A2-2]